MLQNIREERVVDNILSLIPGVFIKATTLVYFVLRPLIMNKTHQLTTLETGKSKIQGQHWGVPSCCIIPGQKGTERTKLSLKHFADQRKSIHEVDLLKT